MLASRAADLLPIYEAARGPEHPIAILTTRQSELVAFHPFDRELPAWNATIAGGTGSGKSFTTRTLLSGWLASGGRLVVATRGRDYLRLSTA
jgi:type IV secretory pathway VirB4 component